MMVITDALDVTFAPNDSPLESLEHFLVGLSAQKNDTSDPKIATWRLGSGVLHVTQSWRFVRISASGGVLAELRLQGAFEDYLSVLSECPHKITRLDAAYDVSEDFPVIHRSLQRRFRSGLVPLSRKGLKVTTMLQRRDDGLQSGTWYAGHRQQAKISARVYDKAKERLDKGVAPDTVPLKWTRYELTFRSEVKCSLKDAYDPSRLFWSVAPVLGLEKPENVPEWFSGCLGVWDYTPPESLPAAKLKQLVEESAHLQALFDAAEKAECVEWFRSLLLRQHAKRFPDCPPLQNTQVEKATSTQVEKSTSTPESKLKLGSA